MNELIDWLGNPANWQGPAGIPSRLIEHVWISFISILAATLVALPVGLYIGHTGRAANLAINIANIGRAVPSYAILVMVLPLSLALAPVLGYSPQLGLRFIPTFTAMVLLAIPPILVNVYAGLRSVDRDLVEAARGMGLREAQILRDVEVPLAASVIVGGFRTAILNVIATATIGAVVGFGGLGRYIVDGRIKGIAGTGELLGGALLVGALAIGVDLALAGLQRLMAARAARAASGGSLAPIPGPV
jgi:osmoprotectant transport system permease protein